MVDPSGWREAVETALLRECRHEKCLGRDAVFDALAVVPDEPTAWCVKKDGSAEGGADVLTVLAVVEGSVLAVSAPCRHLERQSDDEVSVEAKVRHMPRIPERRVEVDVTRKDGGVIGHPRTETVRRLAVGYRADREVVLTSDEKSSPEQAAEFDGVAQALFRRASRPAIAPGPPGSSTT